MSRFCEAYRIPGCTDLQLGLASCFSLWSIPIFTLAENTDRSAIAQHEELVRRGSTYLLPLSRVEGLTLVLCAIIASQHPDAAVAIRWRYYLLAGFILFQAFWFEQVFIFPVNDDISSLRGRLRSKDEMFLARDDHKELMLLLKKWQALHWFRIITPFAGAVVCMAAML